MSRPAQGAAYCDKAADRRNSKPMRKASRELSGIAPPQTNHDSWIPSQ
jgi:hypothetical protein